MAGLPGSRVNTRSPSCDTRAGDNRSSRAVASDCRGRRTSSLSRSEVAGPGIEEFDPWVARLVVWVIPGILEAEPCGDLVGVAAGQRERAPRDIGPDRRPRGFGDAPYRIRRPPRRRLSREIERRREDLERACKVLEVRDLRRILARDEAHGVAHIVPIAPAQEGAAHV